MANKELGTVLNFQSGTAPIAITTDTTTAGSIADIRDRNGVEIVLNATRTAGNVALSIVVGDTADLSDGVTLTFESEDLLINGNSLTAAGDLLLNTTGILKVSYNGLKKYVRVDLVTTGTADVVCSLLVIKEKNSKS